MNLSKIKPMNFMSDDEILRFIGNYINKSSYNYAVLIDGSWGCGKTHFIKKILMPFLENTEKIKVDKNKGYKEKKIIYISLYGITKKEELTNQISIEALPFKNIVKSKGFTTLSSIGKAALGGALSLNGITLPESSFDISNFISLENSILIFDDLERCNMNINEVLGYINNFVEHDEIKAIIVSNEKEISSANLNINREQKLFVALNENIVFPKDDNTNTKKPSGKIEIDELSERVDILFGEDCLYKQIKEKLIGFTIYYKPDINKIIDEIVKSIMTDAKVKELILKNKNFIIEKIDYYEHQNIRTLLFCLDKYIIIAESLLNKVDSDVLDSILEDIFKYIIVFSINYKIGNKLPEWHDNNETQIVSFGRENFSFMDISFMNSLKGFKFVDDFILGGNYKEDRAVEVIYRSIEIQKEQIQDPNDPLNKLNNQWWKLEDGEVKSLIEGVYKSLVDEPLKYNISAYSKILTLNIFLNRIGIQSVDIWDIVTIMKSNLEKFTPDNNFDAFGFLSSDFGNDDDMELYTKCIGDLNRYRINYYEQINEKNINAVLENYETWTGELIKYYRENENNLTSQKAFLKLINYTKLIDAIKCSSSGQILNFRRVIGSVYSFSNIKDYYASDKETIDILIDELKSYAEEIKEFQKIRNYNLQNLIKDLENISQRLI